MSAARDRLVSYLRTTGWSEPTPENIGPAVERWSHPNAESLLPVPHNLDDTGLDWDMIVNRLAMIEGVPTAQMSERLSGDPAPSAVPRLPEALRQALVAGLLDQGGSEQPGTATVRLPDAVVDVDRLLDFLLLGPTDPRGQ